MSRLSCTLTLCGVLRTFRFAERFRRSGGPVEQKNYAVTSKTGTYQRASEHRLQSGALVGSGAVLFLSFDDFGPSTYRG